MSATKPTSLRIFTIATFIGGIGIPFSDGINP